MSYRLKFALFIFLAIATVFFSYQSANDRLNTHADLSKLKLGLNLEQVITTFGNPFQKSRNDLTYILEDDSHLYLSLREGVLTSALLKFQKKLRIDDPTLKTLSLVQMDPGQVQDEGPSWFFAGKPEEGKIYKITSRGEIESITWVKPFTYSEQRPKQLNALFRDFHSRQFTKL